MRIFLHIGPDAQSSDRMQRILDAKREQLLTQGVLYARSPGARSHTRLYMASSDPACVDALRYNRGFGSPVAQDKLRSDVVTKLTAEVAHHTPNSLILSAHHLGSALRHRSEITRLRDMLRPLSSDIRIVAHIADPAFMLLRRYQMQLLDGRARSLTLELEALTAPSFWDAALATWPEAHPEIGRFPEAQGAAFWLDTKRLQSEWEAVFGAGNVAFHTLDPKTLASEDAPTLLRTAFEIEEGFGKAAVERSQDAPSAAWLTRCRMFNDAMLRLMAHDRMAVPRPVWRKLLQGLRIPGSPTAIGSLRAVSKRFERDVADLVDRHPGLHKDALTLPPREDPWHEADPEYGFRATQYVMAHRWRMTQAAKELARTRAAEQQIPSPSDVEALLSPTARDVMPAQAKQNFARLHQSPFAPHNKLGSVDETQLAAAYPIAEKRALPAGCSGNVIVGCMKNEAPYILEWVAYHRAIGFDSFLIYTNGCEDGTTQILDRLQELGVLQHRDNNNWSGNSPQQYALDQSLSEPVIRNADWIAHIDVDEFVNIRCGAGTLQDLFDQVPDATNMAMTWRLFGHNGVQRLDDRFVIDQFDMCAPKYCPKPHTVWGFKTLFRNIGAYGKISCHRTNKLLSGQEDRVKWVNGSGRDMTGDALRNGWRNSRKTIGYDLIQLNHYALRSAESFLIKRQRGRALHVDRNIGLNYWIRMDWSDHRDITIKRNLPRLRDEYDALLADPVLKQWHQSGLAWHRAKADELHGMPEFEDLYQKALALTLTETERVAYALALDMES